QMQHHSTEQPSTPPQGQSGRGTGTTGSISRLLGRSIPTGRSPGKCDILFERSDPSSWHRTNGSYGDILLFLLKDK
ncbi:hypothetical protein V5O48_009111, partial [Marasmius crinis-equi]